MRAKLAAHPKKVAALAVLAALLLLLAWLWLRPFKVDAEVASRPASSYAEAVARIETIQAAEDARGDLDPVCHTTRMDHGDRTDKVVVFLHGFTSCPEQFRELGTEFHERGYNVYIPRTPHHGLADLMTEDLVHMTAEESVTFATEVVDIAQGLGDHVTVAGLSGGGTMATWLAQERGDVDVVMSIAPFLGIGFVPAPLNRPVANALRVLPNIWMWWDPVHKQDNPFASSYGYRRYPTHALEDLMRLGFAAERDARRVKPLVSDIIMVTNANDDSVNNAIADAFVRTWRKHGAELVEAYEFEEDLGLPHDLITPSRPGGHTDVVYPVLLDLLGADK